MPTLPVSLARLTFPLLALFIVVPAAHGQDLGGHRQATVHLDADGRVDEVVLHGELHPRVAALLREDIARWRFESARVDGRPVASVTHLQIGLRARPLADGSFGLEVASVQNGVRLVEVGAMSFPASAMRRNQQGTVEVVATVHPDGRVEVHETRGEAPRALHAAARRMLRSSRFEPEQVDGRPIAARIEKPVRFVIVAAPSSRRSLPVEVGDGPYPAREDDAFRTMDSAVRLLTPVEGRSLGETAASEGEAP